MNLIYDIIIVGAGSSGLYMAKLLEEHNINYLILESFHQIGGQCKNIYPNKYMYDVAGIGKITGEEFITLLLSYIKNTNINLNENFLNYTQDPQTNFFIIKTNKQEYICKKIIFTNGHGTCVFNKPLIDNLPLYENKQIFYFPKNPQLIKNKNIIVFGGGDSALDAIECLYEKNKVTLVHRRHITAYEGKKFLLNNIISYIPYSLYSLEGNQDLLTSVKIKNLNHILDLPCDLIYFCYGYNQDYIPDKIYVNKLTMESNYKNIFAIGAINTYEGKRNLITSNMYECRLLMNYLLKF